MGMKETFITRFCRRVWVESKKNAIFVICTKIYYIEQVAEK